MKYRCSVCKSTLVDTLRSVWMNPNTGVISEEVSELDTWCCECRDHQPLEQVTDPPPLPNRSYYVLVSSNDRLVGNEEGPFLFNSRSKACVHNDMLLKSKACIKRVTLNDLES